MNIQSLSISIPASCLNDCKFCVSKMHQENYSEMLDNLPFYDLYVEDYQRRIEFARDNGCNTVMLTGDGEPILNKDYLKLFGSINKSLAKPFRWVEIQTSGTKFDEQMARFLRNHVWVSTVSLSVSDLYDSDNNAAINQTIKGYEVDIPETCNLIKKYDFNLRLSLNMTNTYDNYSPKNIFEYAKERLEANQITFRVLYESGKNEEKDKWVRKNKAHTEKITEIKYYILEHDKPLEILPFGAVRYSINGMSVVLDDDCMNTKPKEQMKYVILRSDCHLYSRWDDKGSLIF